MLHHFAIRWHDNLELKRLEALLLIAIFVSSIAGGLVIDPSQVLADSETHEFMPPMPQFSSEAPALNFTIAFPVPKPAPVYGEVSVLVIAVEFSNYNHTLSIEEITDKTINRLNAYYTQVSYGAMSVVGKVVGWVKLSHKLADYGADNGPFIDCQNGDGYPDTWELLKDAAPVITDQVNIAEYQQILVLHAGYGQESSRKPDDIWSVTYLRRLVETPQGTFNTFAVVPEFEVRALDTLGVYAHEFGHLLGLPDLYSRTVEEVGAWDLMARGAWNGNPPGSSPAEMLAWDRIFLGWITPERILNVTRQSRVNATVDPMESPSSSVQTVKVVTSSQGSKQYYLVEVRRKIGYDVGLPSSGVLITYIDETKSNPVKVVDAVQTSSTLDDAAFQVGQRYSDSQNSMVISIVDTNGSSFSVIVDTMSPSPDVAVESLTLDPPTVHPNNTASLNLQITNQGSLKAKSFLADVYLNETLFASRKISLSAGETQLIQLTWTPVKGGTYIFKVVLDSENAIAENDEGNNIETLRVTVGYTLTLQVQPPGAGADIQWWLSVNGANETYVGTGEFQIGVLPGSNTLEIQPLIYLNPSSRYVFRQWGDGAISSSRTLIVSSDLTLSADFSLQYLLSLEPNGGVTSSGGWYDSGTPVTVSATSPSNVVEQESRLIFVNWSGDIESDSTTVSIIMNRPYNVAANWKTQYYLHIESSYGASGEGWYDANTQATVSLTPDITAGNGIRYLFVQWSGDLSGVDPSQPIVMSGPKSVSAVWTTLYELRIESEYGHTEGAGWYAPNAQAVFVVDTLALDVGNGTRRVFTKWSGDASGTDPQGTIVMDGPKTIQADWGTQYQVDFRTQGIRNGTSLTIIVDSQTYRVKAPQTINVWRDSGSSVSFSMNATVTEGFRRYQLLDWRDSAGASVKSPQKVLKPETFTARYKELSLFPCIIATVTFGSEISPEVQYLRNFRDHLVLSTRAGSSFMSVFNVWYYSFSPNVADFIASHDNTRAPVRIWLYPLIGILQLSSLTFSTLAFSPELAVVAAGLVASALIGLFYLTPITVFLARSLARRRIRNFDVVKVFSVSCLVALVILALGEVTGSLALLALASSALVLTTLVSAALVFSFVLLNVANHLTSWLKAKHPSFQDRQ